MTVTCFWLEETGEVRLSLRRYRSGSKGGECSGPMGYHDASTPIGTAPILWLPEPPEGADHWYSGRDGASGVVSFDWPDHDDPRWPTRCACGYEFSAEDEWQHFHDRIMRRTDTGETLTIRDAPDGAMWDAYWYPCKGPDGRCVVARCPGGADWIIDGRATNCALPDDTEHRYWVRHGEPPRLTVDKNGLTCAAGAGSIQAGDYHGFLRGRVFTSG